MSKAKPEALPPFRVENPKFFISNFDRLNQLFELYRKRSLDGRSPEVLMNELVTLCDKFGFVLISATVNPVGIAGYMGVLFIEPDELQITQWCEDHEAADIRDLSRVFVEALTNLCHVMKAKRITYPVLRRDATGRVPFSVHRVLTRLGFSLERTEYFLEVT